MHPHPSSPIPPFRADGTSYLTQCPIAQASAYTYSFLVNEAPGTYIWHDHAGVNRANGMQV